MSSNARVPSAAGGVQATRLVVGAIGLAAATYGGWLLWEQRADWLSLVLWLGAGVVLHDFVLSPLLLLGGVLVANRLPPAWRVPVIVGAVVWGSITLLAVPVLGEFGALADNPTLLDRPYVTSWVVGALLVIAAVVTGGLLRQRSHSRPGAARRVAG